MYAWKSIQNTLNYIEKHLSEKMDIDVLAKEGNLSSYYFQRLFKRLVKQSVSEYVRFRRLAKASEELKNSDQRIIDIALEYGFSNHANFTRAFKEAYGITPEEYRSSDIILNHFIKPDLRMIYAEAEEDVPLITEGIVVEMTRRKLDEPRTFIGIKGEVPETELTIGRWTGISTIGKLWNEFHSQKANLLNLLSNNIESAIIYKGDAREGRFIYMVSAETKECVQLEKYDCFILPKGEYVICCLEAENFEELINVAIYKAIMFMTNWVKSQNLICGDFTVEMYYRTSADSSYMELWLPLSSQKNIDEIKEKWDKVNGTQKPSLDMIKTFVNNPLFEDLCRFIQEEYQSKPVMDYSRCSMQYGWNVKYKKAGRSLCTLYPMEGYFIALIVIGEREKIEVEWILPCCTEYVQQLYSETKAGMGQKWLMINVTNEAILKDVKNFIDIRRSKRKNYELK
jgi:AraC family transcriptional regulator